MRVGKTETSSLPVFNELLTREWPRRYTQEEYPEIIAELRAGSPKARERTILSFIPLLGSIVGRYCMKLHTDRHSSDLMSEGLLGIMDAVDRVIKDGLPHMNLGGYIVEYIHQYLSNYTDELPTIPVPGGTIRSRKHRKQNIPDRMKSHRYTDEVGHKDDESVRMLELQDLVASACLSRNDFEIVKFRLQGMTDAEVGQQINMPSSSVSRARQEIGNRLLCKLELLDDD